MLIVRKILVLFSIALIKFIHSFDFDILVRTFYAETLCALLISGISKTLDKRVTTRLSHFRAIFHYYMNDGYNTNILNF